MSSSLIILFFAMVFVPSCFAQINCAELPDGSYGFGCQSYTRCTGGVGQVVDCAVPGWAYDHRTGNCELVTTVPPPCGSIDNNCTGYANMRYPIMPECLYYYTCVNSIFFGSNPCNASPDGELVFDFDLQLCNWKTAVPPPCGTAGVGDRSRDTRNRRQLRHDRRRRS